MALHRPGRISVAATALLAAALTAGVTGAARAQAVGNFNITGNLAGVPLSPSLFDHPAPAPLVPEPGGAFTAQTVTMPVPPLARTTIPSAGGPEANEGDAEKADAAQDDGPSHAALSDRVLAGVR